MNNKDYLFDDLFDYEPITANEQMKQYEYNKRVRGDVRLSQSKYYTDTEKERYKRESLERHLP